MLSIIAAANLFYLLLHKKSLWFYKTAKIVIAILPIFFIAQPLCLATGIGYTQEVTDFFNGASFNAYEYFGAHLTTQYGQDGCVFRVFAPNAVKVEVLCDVNSWQPLRMTRDENNVFSLFVPGVKNKAAYKYKLTVENNEVLYRLDPFGKDICASSEGDRNSAVYDSNNYKFSDDEWMKNRSSSLDKPMNIYEIHAGSWKRKPDGSFYTYTDLKNELIPYLKEHGYNYVEFLPLSESDIYESWGYLPTSPFAVSSRYGSPDELKDLINELHKNNIGVFMDFVDYHYDESENENKNIQAGLSNFDGTELYGFDDDNLKMTIYESMYFNYNKNWVRSFLFSNLN